MTFEYKTCDKPKQYMATIQSIKENDDIDKLLIKVHP